jgi:hypothetical protein
MREQRHIARENKERAVRGEGVLKIPGGGTAARRSPPEKGDTFVQSRHATIAARREPEKTDNFGSRAQKTVTIQPDQAEVEDFLREQQRLSAQKSKDETMANRRGYDRVGAVEKHRQVMEEAEANRRELDELDAVGAEDYSDINGYMREQRHIAELPPPERRRVDPPRKEQPPPARRVLPGAGRKGDDGEVTYSQINAYMKELRHQRHENRMRAENQDVMCNMEDIVNQAEHAQELLAEDDGKAKGGHHKGGVVVKVSDSGRFVSATDSIRPPGPARRG